MQEIWERIESWLSENAPEIKAKLNPGATDDELKEVETSLGVTLPDDVKASYKIHNGQKGNSDPLVGDWMLLSLDKVIKQWQTQKKLFDAGEFKKAKAKAKGAVKADWWNVKWIPVGHNGSGDLYCLDFDPPAKGKTGQIVSYWHADDRRELIAPSFKDWLTELAADFEAGKYKLVEFEGLKRTDK